MMNSRKAYLALGMATLAFIVSFAAWSLLSSLAPQLQQQYRIDDFWISVIIAVPVILGSLARIPMGILTDRFGGRRMMTGLLLFSVIPLLGMTTAANMAGFLIWGFSWEWLAVASLLECRMSIAGLRRSGKGWWWGSLGWAISAPRSARVLPRKLLGPQVTGSRYFSSLLLLS